MQSDQHVLILLARAFVKEVPDGTEVDLRELGQLQRRYRPIAGLQAGHGGSRQAKGIGHRLLTETSGLARRTQPPPKFARVNHLFPPTGICRDGVIHRGSSNEITRIRTSLER